MKRFLLYPLVSLMLIPLALAMSSSQLVLAQEWAIRKPMGTLKVVDLMMPDNSVVRNYCESLVTFDKDNKLTPCLAKDWRWIDNQTIEFKLRADVWFQNGEKFDAEAVKVNWEAYKNMQYPTVFRFLVLPDEMTLDIIDGYTVRFTFPEPDGLAFVKFGNFGQIAPAFFQNHKFAEMNWGFLPEAGPWGTGPFEFVEGSLLRYGKFTRHMVLEANENYWDPRYPKVQKVVFDNSLAAAREDAMKLCRETEGGVDIVNHIRPLDTLKVAESPFAKVVKSRDVVMLWGLFNQRKRESKWTDIRLRKAVNYAMNREELWKYAAKGNAYNLGGFIPSGSFGYNPNLTLYTYDTDKARSLLAEAGYPEGFDVKVITYEAWKVEVQIIKRMLERIGLRVSFDVLTFSEVMTKSYIPALEKPVEEQVWDILFVDPMDWTGQTAASFLVWLTEQSDWRWMKYDPVYEQMWEDMARTVDSQVQEEKAREMVKYFYDRAYRVFIYCPLSLYAVNKEVNFVPHKNTFLILKETSVTDNHWSIRGTS